MPIPNTSPETAIVISSLPFNIVTTANDGGVTHSLWYKYIASIDEVLSIFGFGSLVGYEPLTLVYQEIAGEPDSLPGHMYNPSGRNVPVTFPARAGITYLIKFQHTGAFITPADLKIDIIKHVSEDYPKESLMINDDTWGFPGAILSSTTGEVLKFIQDFPAGELGDSLAISEGGQILVENYPDSTFRLYDSQLNPILTIPSSSLGLASGAGVIGGLTALHSVSPKFYVGKPGGGSVKADFTTISPTGVVGSTKWILPVAGMTSLAVNTSETIAYITGQGSSLNAWIRRWDLINNVLLSDWTVPGQYHEVLILKNDNIIVSSYNSTTKVTKIEEYTSDHTLIHTYSIPNTASVLRMIPAEDNPLSIWLWVIDFPEGGNSTFIKLRLSDGVHLQNFTRAQFEAGTYQPAETETPTDRFGHSYSCPFFLLYQAGVIIPPEPSPIGGIYKMVKGKTHDTLYIEPASPGDPPLTTDTKIPDPSITSFLIGNE